MALPKATRNSFGRSAGLEVRLLGLVDYDAAVRLQEWCVYELSGRSDTHGALLLCEHPPLISIGREGSRSQVTVGDPELRSAEIDIRWVSRGGGAVMHAPGQLAIYPVLPLERLGLGVGEFRRRLESAISNVCHDVRVPAKRMDSAAGLWSRGGQVANFGATLKSWVTMHGMWLNVCPEPGFLKLVTSDTPSADDYCVSRVTSLQDQLLRRIGMPAVRESTMRHVAAAFGYESVHTHTGHPQLQRTRRRVCVKV